MRFLITNNIKLSRVDEIVDFLQGPRLWIPHFNYPDHEQWLKKAHLELKASTKRSLVCFEANRVAGVIIYQRHKAKPRFIELKNFTVRPDLRGRYISSFLLRNMEYAAFQDFGLQRIILDAKAENVALRSFFEKQGYRVVGQRDLYRQGSGDDLIYTKKIALKNGS